MTLPAPARLALTIAAWVLAAALALFLVLLAVNAVLAARLFGPGEVLRMAGADWTRMMLSRDLETGGDPVAAFNRLYGDTIGADASLADIREWYEAAFDSGRPVVFDVVMARYIEELAGQVDARSLPPGLYVGDVPVGPTAWPLRLIGHYAIFARHGHLLVVAPAEDGNYPRTREAMASIGNDFDTDAPGGALYARWTEFGPEGRGYADPGDPIHVLYRISDDPEIAASSHRDLESAIERVQSAEIEYRLWAKNSNAGLGCFLRISGAPSAELDRLLAMPGLGLRLPGIDHPLWSEGDEGAIPECTEPDED